MKKFLLSILWKLLLVVLGFFAVTFTMYFFNLDMKATAMVAPLLESGTTGWRENNISNETSPAETRRA
jgi:hypothetical protein